VRSPTRVRKALRIPCTKASTCARRRTISSADAHGRIAVAVVSYPSILTDPDQRRLDFCSLRQQRNGSRHYPHLRQRTQRDRHHDAAVRISPTPLSKLGNSAVVPARPRMVSRAGANAEVWRRRLAKARRLVGNDEPAKALRRAALMILAFRNAGNQPFLQRMLDLGSAPSASLQNLAATCSCSFGSEIRGE
jgi:hypothetical protein